MGTSIAADGYESWFELRRHCYGLQSMPPFYAMYLLRFFFFATNFEDSTTTRKTGIEESRIIRTRLGASMQSRHMAV
jgi:hypothetical protein